ncbi:pitrilysin family protein, partial [Pelomonas sp. KK5]|uniref:M16 family metallopeptidase n=1 Tax=Pelomonas sp. KK5 TaxID=1855730 RepID=UPI0011804884
MSMLARLLSLLTLMLMAPVLVDAAPAAGFTEIRSIGGITEYRLDANGLQLLLMPVARAPRTSVTVIYRVGSRHERGAAEAGMAHLLEHVSFHGAAGVPDIAVELQRLGVRFNATTSTDRTNYFASFAAGERGTLQRVLELEAARMSGARLDESDIAREKPIVLDELALRGQAVLPQLQQALAATAFRSHAYGRPVIGSVASIEQLSLPVLREFYARHYRPDHAVLMLAGAFE